MLNNAVGILSQIQSEPNSDNRVIAAQSIVGSNIPYKEIRTINGIEHVIDINWLRKLDSYMSGDLLCAQPGSADLKYIYEYMRYCDNPTGFGWCVKVEELLNEAVENTVPVYIEPATNTDALQNVDNSKEYSTTDEAYSEALYECDNNNQGNNT
jgi:hypothetical protein